MADEPELARPDSRSSGSSDEETVKGDRDEGHIASVPEEEDEFQPFQSPAPRPAPSAIAHRYRELLEAEHETASEDGSNDGLPRLAASPMGSMLSIPDDSPSLQVYWSCIFERLVSRLTMSRRAPSYPDLLAAVYSPPSPSARA